MHIFSVLLFLLLLCTVTALAEEEYPRFEAFGGYSLGHVVIGPDVPFADPSHVNGSGFNVSAAGYFNRWFGAVADFSGHFNSQQVSFRDPFTRARTRGTVETRVFPLAFGPQFRFPTRRVTPFGRVMFGWFRRNIDAPGFKPRDNDFAITFGGGLDLRATDRLALRIGQVDYIRSHLTPTDWQNNVRFSTGLVFTY
jgi:opacity protein-like surface antigen